MEVIETTKLFQYPSSSVGLRKYLVELSGIEPLTSCMPCKRSPDWAIAPNHSLPGSDLSGQTGLSHWHNISATGVSFYGRGQRKTSVNWGFLKNRDGNCPERPAGLMGKEAADQRRYQLQLGCCCGMEGQSVRVPEFNLTVILLFYRRAGNAS